MARTLTPVPLLAQLALVAALVIGRPARAAEPLPALGADESRLSVSGLSSGAYMAGQFQIAYSRLVIGAGLVAGGPYGCASRHNWYYDWIAFTATLEKRNLGWALAHCTEDGRFAADGTLMLGVPGADALASQARTLAARGAIDDLSGIQADRIYLFSSSADETVRLSVMQRAKAFYEALGVPPANIAFKQDSKATHAFVTEDKGAACGKADDAYVTDCDYNQAGAILDTLHGAQGNQAASSDGKLLTFDQRPFLAGESAGMADEGMVYVPQSCVTQAGCAVHVVFHGCEQYKKPIHEKFIAESGFLPAAAAKGIVLLFPRAKAIEERNPKGCWDWWGYTGANFLERDAPQMAAVRGMIRRLAEARP